MRHKNIDDAFDVVLRERDRIAVAAARNNATDLLENFIEEVEKATPFTVALDPRRQIGIIYGDDLDAVSFDEIVLIPPKSFQRFLIQAEFNREQEVRELFDSYLRDGIKRFLQSAGWVPRKALSDYTFDEFCDVLDAARGAVSKL